MAVSEPVRRYYAAHIFAQTTRESPPPNFRPLEGEATGRATIEGCRGGGKNILEVFLRGSRPRGETGRVADCRATCGLCNPAMMAAADLALDWARGRDMAEILALDPEAPSSLAPILAPLAGDEPPPEDALEKAAYALLALQDAVRDHGGGAAPTGTIGGSWDSPSTTV